MPLSRTELGIGSGLIPFHLFLHLAVGGHLLVVLHLVGSVLDCAYGVPAIGMLRFHVPSPCGSCADRKRVNQRRVPSVGKESDGSTSGRVHSFDDGIAR
jgi:hypothetical protein